MTAKARIAPDSVAIDSPEAYLNRELSFLSFARRVLSLAQRDDLPLLERVKFAGIIGILHDEFFMKRIGGIKRQIRAGRERVSVDGRTPQQELEVCRKAVLAQVALLSKVVRRGIRPALEAEGIPIVDYHAVSKSDRRHLREYFRTAVMPILTPLAADAEHPFPFVSNLGLNLAIYVPGRRSPSRFVRVKMPSNRPRWVPLPDGRGWVPLEQIIAANLDLFLRRAGHLTTHAFRVTRGADGDVGPDNTTEDDPNAALTPGSIIRQVSSELKARKFAGAVRLQVESAMPRSMQRWLVKQLGADVVDVYPTNNLLGLADLLTFDVEGAAHLRAKPHRAVTHPRLRGLNPDDPGAIFDEIRRGDILLHHPYHDFDTSVVTFLESAATDPKVLAIKLTIYRTNSQSPIVQALTEAARRGKEVAVLVEITARFDEAPNIAWGQRLEKEGVHVSYGVRKLKTHVKLALVVREEQGVLRRYVHVGTGNYHSGTARLYEDLGVLTCRSEHLSDDVTTVFNQLTGAAPRGKYHELVVAPVYMRKHFVSLIRREAKHAKADKPSGIYAKMNQLEDVEIIRELYRASQAGVPITLNVRGVCRLRPRVRGLSATIRVYGVVSRFLEHSRIYKFENAGDPEYFIGSLDWMRRNLDSRVETLLPISDVAVKHELEEILQAYERDNDSVWDCRPSGSYRRRRPAPDEKRWAAQEIFISRANGTKGEGS